MLKIEKGKINRPQKVVIYGAEGIGKSTLASNFPDPLFVDTEGGTSHMDVNRINCSETWDALLGIVKEVAATPDVCKTLVIDTADWAESLCERHVCNQYRKANIEDFGYGKGYTYLSDEFSKLLGLLDKVIAAGINVVITAHGKPRKYELPEEQGQFDRWEMKLTKQVAPLLKEWSDMLLFCNYKTIVISQENGNKKAQGNERKMYTTHNACWDAKNRHGLADELDLSYSAIAHIFEGVKPAPEKKDVVTPLDENVMNKLKTLMAKDNVTEDEVAQVIKDKGDLPQDGFLTNIHPEYIIKNIIPNWNKIVTYINKNKTLGGNQ